MTYIFWLPSHHLPSHLPSHDLPSHPQSTISSHNLPPSPFLSGIFGTFLGDGKNCFINCDAGHLLRLMRWNEMMMGWLIVVCWYWDDDESLEIYIPSHHLNISPSTISLTINHLIYHQPSHQILEWNLIHLRRGEWPLAILVSHLLF